MAGLSHRGGSYDLLQDQERMLSLSSCLVGAGRMWPLMGKQVFRPMRKVCSMYNAYTQWIVGEERRRKGRDFLHLNFSCPAINYEFYFTILILLFKKLFILSQLSLCNCSKIFETQICFLIILLVSRFHSPHLLPSPYLFTITLKQWLSTLAALTDVLILLDYSGSSASIFLKASQMIPIYSLG